MNYKVLPKPQTSTAGVYKASVSLIKTQYSCQSGVIFTLSQKETKEIAFALCEAGVVAACYHGGMPTFEKEQNCILWMQDKVKVMVTTSRSFGLGINKSNVMYVLHHYICKNMMMYYQESGQAGHNGEIADCILYYSP